MTIYLGIDGGGSTCRARAVDATGRVLGEGAAGPANISSDLEAALAAVDLAARAALGSCPLEQAVAALGMAGANNPEAAQAFRAGLPFAESRVVTDGHISVLGALGSRDGIVTALGTGSVFVLQRGGVQREIGGKGLVLGDEASGAWMGRRLLSRALRADDGFQPMTPLLRQVLAELGGPAGCIAFAAAARPADFAAFTRHIIGSTDPAALSILTEAQEECLLAIDLLQAGDKLPVVCLGGLAAVFEPVVASRWQVEPPGGAALDGAITLARTMRPSEPQGSVSF